MDKALFARETFKFTVYLTANRVFTLDYHFFFCSIFVSMIAPHLLSPYMDYLTVKPSACVPFSIVMGDNLDYLLYILIPLQELVVCVFIAVSTSLLLFCLNMSFCHSVSYLFLNTLSILDYFAVNK